jgi:hypothetical protein
MMYPFGVFWTITFFIYWVFNEVKLGWDISYSIKASCLGFLSIDSSNRTFSLNLLLIEMKA